MLTISLLARAVLIRAINESKSVTYSFNQPWRWRLRRASPIYVFRKKEIENESLSKKKNDLNNNIIILRIGDLVYH